MLFRSGLLKAYLDSCFAERVTRKQDQVVVAFEKVSLQHFLTKDYFEALSKTKLKARISDNQGKVELIFDVRNQKDYTILEELIIFAKTLATRKEEKEK